MYQGLIFDLDGTLVDTSPAFIQAYQYTCEKFGIPETDYTAILPYASHNTTHIFSDRHGLTDEAFEQAHACYYAHMKANDHRVARLFPGIREMLCTLSARGVKMCLATARHPGYLEPMLKAFDLAKHFLYSRINKECSPTLDKSIFIADCASKMGIEVSACLMIGDSVHDIKGASIAGAGSVWTKYGYGVPEEVLAYQPDYIAETPAQLSTILMGAF